MEEKIKQEQQDELVKTEDNLEQKASRRLKYEIVGLAMKLAFIAIVLSLLTTFVFGFKRIENRMMYPSIQPGDLAIYYRLTREFKYADTVAIEEEDKKNILRVIAVPGDTVDITDQGVLVNNAIMSEDYKSGENLLFPSGTKFPLKLGKDELFVLGDRREESQDSRLYGPVPMDRVAGKVIFIFRGRQNAQ